MTTTLAHVPRGTTIEAPDVFVTGDVAGVIIARGGGARVEILGDVTPTATVLASGGGAEVIIHGNTSQHARVGAAGGRALVRIFGSVVA